MTSDAAGPRPGTVTALVCYPIKGCAGMPVRETLVTPAGLAHDRSFMVIDANGAFRSQRRDPRLAVVRPLVDPDGTHLTLRVPGTEDVRIRVDPDGPRRTVRLFKTRYQGVDQGDTAAEWLTDVLGGPSRLVRVPPEHHRVTDGETPGTCGYADSGAVHLVSRSSLDLLNQRITESGDPPISDDRFRANIIVAGWPQPHTEDRVRRVTVGTTDMAYAKLAIRCAVTLVDQSRGVGRGPQPLRALAAYRRTPQGVAFGVKLAVTRPGRLAVGDAVLVRSGPRAEIVSAADAPAPVSGARRW